MDQKVDCVVAGHICLDVTPRFLKGGASVGEMLRPGSLVQVGSPIVSTGGPVSNTGFPLRRLGNTVRLMGKCGDDMFGHALIERIRQEAPGSEAGMHVVPGEQTSYTVVVNAPGIDRIFLHCPGANDTFEAGDIDLATVAQARLMHFGYPPLMARTYADDGAQLVQIFKQAKATGVTTSLDMAYPDPGSPAADADWATILKKTLPYVDLFTPSVEELLLMLRRDKYDELAQKAGQHELLDHIDGKLLGELGDQCIAYGAAVVLIKCGWMGLYARTAGRGRFSERIGRGFPRTVDSWVDREMFEPGYKVQQVVSATGAGDCAIAAFLTSCLRDCTLDDAVRNAAAVGAQNVTAADSISGVKTWEETLRQVASRPPKYTIKLDLKGFTLDTAQDHYVGPRDGSNQALRA